MSGALSWSSSLDLLAHLSAVDLRSCRDESGLDAFLVTLGVAVLGEPKPAECLRVDYVTNEESDLSQGIVRNA
ncbi:hypothetical protein [Plantactinospora sp. B5E13]|uniref:hypothetical protein n=1 Tax=unclassified Plantactinospora TaxID=2631981 RepID=UPI00325E7751